MSGIEVQGTSAGTTAPGEILDPTGEREGAAEEMAALTEHRVQEDAVVAFGGDVVAADVGWAPAEAIAAQSEAKAESDAEVEEYRGPHVCLICFESVQGQSALNCSECDCQTAPRGTSHVKKDTKYVENCPQCGAIRSVQAFTGANFWTAAPSAMIDLTGEGGGVAAVAALTARGAREEDEAAASAVRARSLCGQRPASDTAQRMWATVRRRGRGPVRLVAAAGQGARGQWSSKGGQEEAAGKEAVEEAGKAGRGTQAVQAAAGQRRGRVERAAGNGHRQTQTREGAAGGASEQEGGRRGNASTIGEETGARSAEGRASASTLGKGASARSAEGRASASTLGKGAGARSAEGRASASTIG